MPSMCQSQSTKMKVREDPQDYEEFWVGPNQSEFSDCSTGGSDSDDGSDDPDTTNEVINLYDTNECPRTATAFD